ncbi:dynein regulatory complex subunit 3 [Megalops cyprinoides]|uniref:dynein regulatory complex subunit 3 n=1 Tax=Megalops cyprinoides TaxID=118141 RepID=UPI001864742A|nr:dynein regulatory complex subunit 3 [Megalops cyprinoides]
MSQLHETVEPNVVDEEMLRQAVEEQGPQGQAGRIAKEEGIQFEDVRHLRLDFRNILKIDHLWQFNTLTKLQLDNNIIEKIEGLDCLTNLVWLDLSFNHIEVIEGLDALVKLEDLSLSDNSISLIENMDTLVNLHVFSIGNNQLSQLDNVIYLRKFKNLRSLNLSGNPVSKDPCYKEFIAAYLPDLAYLDFRRLDKETREKALAKYHYALEERIHNETLALKAIQAKKKEEEELQQHKAAFVELLNGPQLFDSMYAEDTEADKLAYLPGVSQLVDTYKSQMMALCVQLFELGLEQQRTRDEDVNCFFECTCEAVQDNQQVAADMISDFERARRDVMAEMQRTTDTQTLMAQFTRSSEETRQLRDTLMSLELTLSDQLEDVIKDFERNLSDMVAVFIEAAQGIFAQCRDLENQHNEKLLEISMAVLEKAAKNELEEDTPDEVRMLCVDKDTVINAVGASHDTHLVKIDNREDELVTRINSWLTTLIKSIHEDEVARNRKRISEIHNYIDYVMDQLEDMNPS